MSDDYETGYEDYEMGREMIVGAGDYDELLSHATGAEPMARRPPPPQYNAQPPQLARYDEGYRRRSSPETRRGPRLERDEPTRARQFPIGLTRRNILPNDTVEIEVKPQVHFRGERFAIAPSIARYFSLIDIKVGAGSQLAAIGEMGAECFSALSVGTSLELDTAEPGIVIVVIVRNTDAATHDFQAVLYGTVLK